MEKGTSASGTTLAGEAPGSAAGPPKRRGRPRKYAAVEGVSQAAVWQRARRASMTPGEKAAAAEAQKARRKSNQVKQKKAESMRLKRQQDPALREREAEACRLRRIAARDNEFWRLGYMASKSSLTSARHVLSSMSTRQIEVTEMESKMQVEDATHCEPRLSLEVDRGEDLASMTTTSSTTADQVNDVRSIGTLTRPIFFSAGTQTTFSLLSSRCKSRRRENLLKCLQCESVFTSEEHLVKHRKLKHTRKGLRHQCIFCEYSSNNKRSVDEHEWTHLVKKTYACKSCTKVFPTKYAYSAHIRISHKMSRK